MGIINFNKSQIIKMPRGGGRSSSGSRGGSGGGGGGGFFSRGPSRPAAAAPRPAPRPAPRAPAPAQQPAAGGGMMSGMGGMVMTGMALGAGSEVGHMAVKAMTGGGASGQGQAPAEGQQQGQAPAEGQYGQQD